jgi:hypothetical protein
LYYGDAWNGVPIQFMKDYAPTQKDMDIVRQRINEKLNK